LTNNTLPGEILNQVSELINKKDLNSLVELNEPDVSFINQSGTSFNGREKIREIYKGFLDMNGKLESKLRKTIPADNIVLT
jgi:ketosteroid isomerase-like protein